MAQIPVGTMMRAAEDPGRKVWWDCPGDGCDHSVFQSNTPKCCTNHRSMRMVKRTTK